jgi:hypothetical protein
MPGPFWGLAPPPCELLRPRHGPSLMPPYSIQKEEQRMPQYVNYLTDASTSNFQLDDGFDLLKTVVAAHHGHRWHGYL